MKQEALVADQGKKYIRQGREEGHSRLVADYFSNQPVFPPNIFRRRFRMNKEVFIRIVDSLSNHSYYFRQKEDATGSKGLSPLQKCTAAIRQLAYGTPADQNDEYVRIGESTAIESLKKFCRGVIEVFGSVYLRRPNTEDIERILQQGKIFWRRITEYYNEFRKDYPPRTQTKVKGHYYQIIPSINEFNQIFINIYKQYHSGWSDDQVKDAARKLFYSTYKKIFKYEHAWVILKDERKWNGGSTDDVHTKRRKTSSSSYTSSDAQTSIDTQVSINIEDCEAQVRPMGKKKATRKQKEKCTTSKDDVNNLRDLINETNSLRMSKIDKVSEHVKEIKDSFVSSQRIKEIKMLTESTEDMTDVQLGYHLMLCDEIKAKYGL